MAKTREQSMAVPELPSDNIAIQAAEVPATILDDVDVASAPAQEFKAASSANDLAARLNGKTVSLMLEIPLVDVPEGGHIQRGFHFALNSAQAKKLKLIRMSLHEAGVIYNDGRIQRHVDRAHDVFGLLLDRLEIA